VDTMGIMQLSINIFVLKQKIIFYYANKRNNLLQFLVIFLIILSIQILNSYLIYLLNNFDYFNLIYFYSINFIFLISTFFLVNKILQ